MSHSCIGLSTIDGGTNWNNGSFSFAFIGLRQLRRQVLSRRELLAQRPAHGELQWPRDDANSANPNGKRFNEHQTEASSLTNLRAASYFTYTTDGTLGDPGTLSLHWRLRRQHEPGQNFDTFPIWTDVRSGFPAARTQDLCYADCLYFLSPDSPLSVGRTSGSTFTDFYSLNMDPSTGSGADFWNVVGRAADGQRSTTTRSWRQPVLQQRLGIQRLGAAAQ